jgi:hypothetical protein
MPQSPEPWVHRGHGRKRLGLVVSGVAFLLLLLALLWASDSITLQDERTIFTAECDPGTWNGSHCTGTLAAGARYRFRVLRQSGQVLFWKIGTTEPEGHLAPCDITDGRNWTCRPGPDARRSITLQMLEGRPVVQPGDPTLPSHAIAKWRWWLLRAGIPAGHDARSW